MSQSTGAHCAQSHRFRVSHIQHAHIVLSHTGVELDTVNRRYSVLSHTDVDLVRVNRGTVYSVTQVKN